MKKIFKKFGLSLAALACVTCAGVGVVMSSSNSASEVQADIAASDYYVSGAGVRLVNDANGTGLRFHTNISVAEYGEILSSGTLIIPEVRCDGNLTLDDLNNSDVKTRPVHVVTKGEDKNGNPVDLWYDTTVGDTPMKKSTVYLYNIPESSYGARMVAVSYVTTGEGTFYTPTAPNTSISDVAKSALNNASLTDAQKAQVSPYVVDEVTVTYNMPNGSTQTEKVAYGSQLSGPTYNTDTYVLSGATDQYGNQINFADYEATLPVNLDVVLATKTTVVTQWIKDCYAATAVERAFVNGSTATTVTEGIPNGYSSVLKLDWYSGSTAMWDLDNGNRDLYRVCFDNTDLSSYDKVTFAMKLETNGDAYIATKNGGTNFGANVWLYFELVQTSANVWTVTITNTAGEILYTTEGLVRNSNGFNKNVDSIGPLLFCAYSTTADAPKLVVRCPSSTTDMTASIYMTEVIGYVNVPDFDPEISEDAEILWNHVWNAYYFTGGAGAEGAYSEEAAPDGYSYVSEYSFVGGDFPKTGHLNNSDVSDYSDLYFAMKVANGTDIYVQGGQTYTGDDWLYIHLHQEDDGKWTKTLRAANGYEATQTGLTGYQYKCLDATAQTFETLRAYPTLTDLLSYTYGFYGAGNAGSYPRGNGSTESTAYFTEVLAIKKDGSITPPAAPDYATGSFEVDVPADAITARSYVWRDDRWALSASTTETAPEGYNNIVEFSYLHNPKSWATTQTNFPSNALDTTLDISKYSDLYFATKMTGSTKGHYINGTGKFVLTDDWVYVHYKQDTSAGTWSMSLSSPDTTEANVGENVKTGVSATDLNALILATLYSTRTSATEDVYVYYTEVFGVPVSEPTTDRVIYSAVDGAISTTDAIGIPTGFTSAFKYENFSADKFAAMDLTDTIYQEISFGMLANTTNVMLTDAYNDFEGFEPSNYANFRATTSNSGAMYLINLVNNGSGSWTVTVNTTVYFDPKAAADGTNLATQNQPSYTATVTGNSLSEIMSTFMQITDKVTTVYVTEVRGTHTCAYNNTKSLGNGYLQDYCVCGKTIGDPVEFAHGIDENADSVRYAIWRDDKFCLSSSTTEAIPVGFNSIVEFDWLNGGNGYYSTKTEIQTFIYDTTLNISLYSDLYFAQKVVNGRDIYVNCGTSYDGGDWLYAHYTQDMATGTWSLSLSSPDGYSAENVQTGISATTLQVLTSYVQGKVGLYARRNSVDEATLVYYTDILGVIACTHEGYDVNYVSNNNGTHNEVCANCNTVITANVACAGGTADCTNAAVCSTCNTAYGTALGHGDTTWNWGVETCNVCGETVGTAATVASSAVIDSSNAHLTLSNNAAGVTAPAGFSSVTNLFSANGNTWSSKILGSADFAQATLDAFSEVWFAIAIQNGHFTNSADNWKALDSDSELVWVKFHMTQTATDVWTVSIYVADTLYNTFENRPGDTIYELIENNNNGLRLVIYQQTDGTYSNADTNVYATEVLGVFETGIPTYATNVWDHIWNADDVGTDVDVAAPEGFTSVNKVTWSGTNANNYWPSNKVNASTEISAYSDLWFAMKVENTDIWCEGIGSYTSGGWLYFHLYQNSDGTWSKAFRSVDGWYNDSKQQNLNYTNLKNLLEYLGGGEYFRGSYPNWVASGVEGVVYTTNVVGVLKCDGTNHTATTYVSNGDGTHSVFCYCGATISESVTCAGGVDTCKSGAICSDCGYEYGTVGTHTGGADTCTTGAICDVCGSEYGTALGHSGAWSDTNENEYVCTRCDEVIGTVTTNPAQQTDVALFENATYAASGASETGAFDATVATPANINLSALVGTLAVSNVANVKLNGVAYDVEDLTSNILTINVVPYDVFGEYTLTATITVEGKTFDVEMPILVITDLITDNDGLLNVRKVLRGQDRTDNPVDENEDGIVDPMATEIVNGITHVAYGGAGGIGTMNGMGYYKLGANITMSEVISSNTHSNVYTNQKVYVFGINAVPFVGTFDGDGYSLINFASRKNSYNKVDGVDYHMVQDLSSVVNDATAAATNKTATVGMSFELEASLFGLVNGVVKNVAIENIALQNNGNVVLGGNGTFENVYFTFGHLMSPRYSGDNTLQQEVAPLLQRSSGSNAKNMTLRNVVINLTDCVFGAEGATVKKVFHALIGGGLGSAQNVAVYGFDTAWVQSDGTSSSVYTNGSDGSDVGIYVEYVKGSDPATNGASFLKIALSDDIWKIVDGVPYLKNVSVSGTESAPSDSNDAVAPEEGVEYSLVWTDNVVPSYETAQFIKSTTTSAFGEGALGVNVANLSDFNTKQIIIGSFETYGKYVNHDDLVDGATDYGVYNVDNTIFVLSETEEGLMYAAKELCRRLYGWNQLTYLAYDSNAIVLNGVTAIDASLVGNYTTQFAFEHRDPANDKGLSTAEKNDFGFTPGSAYTNFVSMHNSANYFGFTSSTDEANHTDMTMVPEWTIEDTSTFATSDGSLITDSNGNTQYQLCYTGHGNATTFWAMVDQVVTIIKAKKAAVPSMKVINFMVEDNTYSCECTTCAQFAPSVTQLLFLNTVQKQLNADGVGVGIEFFAYNAYSSAPVLDDTASSNLTSFVNTLNENAGSHQAITLSTAPVDYSSITKYDTDSLATTVLQAEEGLRLWWTTHEMNHSFPMEHEANAHIYPSLLAWIASIGGKNVDVFAYQAAYRNYFIPLNTWQYQIEYYQTLHKLGVNSYMFNLGDVHNPANAQTGFSAFKTYIDSRAMTDVNVTFDQLKQEFFGYTEDASGNRTFNGKGYYGAGGEKMLQFFEELVAVYEGNKQSETTGFVKTTEDVKLSTTGGSTGYIASWLYNNADLWYSDTFTNYYDCIRQGFFNGSYGWGIIPMVFGKTTFDAVTLDAQGSNTSVTHTFALQMIDLYVHSNYGTQQTTLEAWYQLCLDAITAVNGDKTYTKRIQVESIFPEYALLQYHSTISVTAKRNNALTNSWTQNSVTWVMPTTVGISESYQAFYDKIIALGVSCQSEFYQWNSLNLAGTALADGATINTSMTFTNNTLMGSKTATVSVSINCSASPFVTWGVVTEGTPTTTTA